MKKVLALVLVLAMALGMSTMVASAETAEGLKLGLNIDAVISSSKDAADADGNAQVDAIAVAVLVDAEGKIVDLAIDTAQTKMPFTAEGKLGESFPTEVKSKSELGDDYGMRAASGIGKEWFEQIAALREYMIGKTVDELTAIALDDATHATDEEITAGCTIKIGGYINSVVSAISKATDCDAAATDKVGLGIVTSVSSSKEATADADGLCQAYSYYAAVTANADGAITACRIDATQGNVNFDATGKVTSDLTARVSTKQELGDDYGMRAASGIGKEWNEQADAFAAYVTTKTAADIEGIAMDETTKATDEELLASVTIHIGDMQSVVLKALTNAQ